MTIIDYSKALGYYRYSTDKNICYWATPIKIWAETMINPDHAAAAEIDCDLGALLGDM